MEIVPVETLVPLHTLAPGKPLHQRAQAKARAKVKAKAEANPTAETKESRDHGMNRPLDETVHPLPAETPDPRARQRRFVENTSKASALLDEDVSIATTHRVVSFRTGANVRWAISATSHV